MFQPSTFAQLAGLSPWRAPRRQPGEVDHRAVLIRPAAPADEDEIARLAALEERPILPAGERLVAELEGRVVAAFHVATGRALADPFVPTRAIVELLGLRAAQVRR